MGYHIHESGPMELCIFPLNTVLFPGVLIPIQVFEPRYKKMIARVLAGDHRFGVVLIRRGFEVGGPAEPFEVGTVARVIETKREPGGRLALAVRGEGRFRIGRLEPHPDGYLVADVEPLPELPEDADYLRTLADEVRTRYAGYFQGLARMAPAGWPPAALASAPDDPAAFAYWVAATLPIGLGEKQRLLELDHAGRRLAAELSLLRREQALADRLGYLADHPAGDPGRHLLGRSN